MFGRTCKRLGYILGVLTALGTGPVLIPFFVNTDPIINIYAQTPDVEPVSGWYGPGAWIACVLTTLNALCHHFALCWHMIVDHTDSDEVKCKHCPKEDWDADWLVSLVYTSFSSADLIRRSIPIINSDKLVGMQGLPAIRAAATTVYIGSGASDLALVLMTLVAYKRRKQPAFFSKMGLLRWKLILTIGVLNIIGILGVVLHQKAIQAQNFFMTDDEQKERLHLSVGLLELYGLKALALDGIIIKVLIMLPLDMPWWAWIYGIVFWGGLLYMLIWREAPRFDLKSAIRVVGTFISLWLYLPVCVPALCYLVTILYAIVGAWSIAWLVLTPGSGYFPYSGISLIELDQMGALVTIIVVFGVRMTSTATARLVAEVRQRLIPLAAEDIELGPHGEEVPVNGLR